MPNRLIEPADDAPAPTRRLRLTVAYDGRPFRGWQNQAHGNTIQNRLETALATLCRVRRIVVHGSGRTDAGVHAHAQVVHADVPAGLAHTPDRWRGALNARLPAEIRVRAVRFVPDTFHARFSARGKVYRYRIWNGPVLDPFELGRAWHLPGDLDMAVLEKTSRLFIGQHDFAGFAARRGQPDDHTERTIRRVVVRRRGALVTVEYEGDGFLYKMVRLMTGSLVRCAQGRALPDWIAGVLAGRGKSNFAAPADGLYLLRVLYGGK